MRPKAVAVCLSLVFFLVVAHTQAQEPVVTNCTPQEACLKNLTKFALDTDSESVDRYASFEAAVSAIGSAVRTLIISSPTAVNTTTVVPKTLTLGFIGDGRLDPATGVTITINSPVAGWPLRQIFGGSGTVTFSPGAPIAAVYPQWWGAADGTDSTEAFKSAFAAIAGLGAAFDNRGRRLHIPSGNYILSSKHVFRFKGNHDGVIIEGEGPYNTVLTYTYNAAEADNYLFYHDRAVDGQTVDWSIRDMLITGPGHVASGGNAGFMYVHSGTGGSGSPQLSNLLIREFKEGFRIVGNDADNDKYYLNRVLMFNVDTCFYSDNSQSVLFTIVNGTFATPPGSAGAIFHVKAGGKWTIVGGGYAVQGSSAVVRYDAGYRSVRAPLSFFGFNGELHDTSKLVDDLVPDGASRTRMATFVGCGVNVFGTLPRNVITIREAGTVAFNNGVLTESQIELIATTNSGINGPPRFTAEDSILRKLNIIETFPTGQNANRPVVQLRRLGVDETIPELPLDRDTGPMTALSRGRITRPHKVAYLALRHDANFDYVLPGAGQKSVSITIPPGSNITKVRLVMLRSYAGTPGMYTVGNGDGTKTYILKPIGSPEPAFVQEADTTLQLTEANGQDAIVKITASELNSAPNGYVEILYY